MASQIDRLPGRDTRDADHDRYPPRDGRHDDLRHPFAFVVREQRRFAGVDRRHDAVRAGVHAEADAALQRLLVDLSPRIERCYRDREHAAPLTSHGHSGCHASTKSVNRVQSLHASDGPHHTQRRLFGERGTPVGFTARAFTKAMGFTQADLGKPVIGIAQTWSEFNNCNHHFRELAEAVKRGVWQEGGLPLEFPTISLGRSIPSRRACSSAT